MKCLLLLLHYCVLLNRLSDVVHTHFTTFCHTHFTTCYSHLLYLLDSQMKILQDQDKMVVIAVVVAAAVVVAVTERGGEGEGGREEEGVRIWGEVYCTHLTA